MYTIIFQILEPMYFFPISESGKNIMGQWNGNEIIKVLKVKLIKIFMKRFCQKR